MPVETKTDLRGYTEVRGLFDPYVVRFAARSFLQKSAKLLRDTVRGYAPKDTKALARSMQATVTSMTATVTSTSAYVEAVEYGRSPGAQPPIGSLIGWLNRHGLDPRLEYPIARAIGRRGIKGRFFIQRAIQKWHESTDKILAATVSDIQIYWRAQGLRKSPGSSGGMTEGS